VLRSWPVARSRAAYDSLGDRMLVYGGFSLITPAFGIGQQDLWSLQFAGSVVGVSDAAPRSPWIVGLPSPNPSREGAHLTFELGRSTMVKAAIYDVAGRRLKTLSEGLCQPGHHELSWDGRDAGGRRMPSGMYFCRLDLGGSAVTRKVSLIR